MQNSLGKKKKKTCTNFVPKCRWVRLVKNFDLNQMLACVHENLYIAHSYVQERNAKFFRKKKEKLVPILYQLVPILYQNATGSDW